MLRELIFNMAYKNARILERGSMFLIVPSGFHMATGDISRLKMLSTQDFNNLWYGGLVQLTNAPAKIYGLSSAGRVLAANYYQVDGLVIDARGF